MTNRNIIVIGASAGGIEALIDVMRNLSPELRAAIFFFQHVAGDFPSYLHRILQRETDLSVRQAVDRQTIQRGTVSIAPANYHLIIDADQMFLSKGPRENRVRPAIDPLFRSAALAHGPKVIGVILSGALDDGTAGLMAVKAVGGLAIVQDPETALTPDMPSSAAQYVDIDHCQNAEEIGKLLTRLWNQLIVLRLVSHFVRHEDNRQAILSRICCTNGLQKKGLPPN